MTLFSMKTASSMKATSHALAIGGFMLTASAALAQTRPGATFDEILAGAKREGKLVAWIAAPRGPEAHKALIDAFNAKFGLNTVLEWVPNPPVTSNTRAIAESAGGKVSVDIIGAGAIEEVASATGAKLLTKYDWTGVFGSQLPEIKALEARVMAEFRGFALPYQVIAYGIGWNPASIADADVPKKWTDLSDPKWQGKVGFNSFLAPMEIMSYTMGPDATLDYAKKLFANKPVFERGTPAVARAITTGVVPFGITISPVAETIERSKGPLKFRLMEDIIPLSQVYLYVPENSPNPNTARLFAAWLAAQGSAVGDKHEPMARPGDPDTPLGKLINDQVTRSGAKIAEATKVDDIASSAKMREQLQQLLASQPK
jgi:iron(III) transport system substrate-binding protein